MRLRRGFLGFGAAATFVLGGALSACEDAPSGSTSDAGLDARVESDATIEPQPDDADTPDATLDGSSKPDMGVDAAPNVDAAPITDANAQGDAQGDAADAADAAPVVTTSIEGFGYFDLRPEGVTGLAFEDDFVITLPSVPECVVDVRSRSKPASKAGALTVGGPIVGVDGGPAQPVSVSAGGGNQYYVEGPLVPLDDGNQLIVALAKDKRTVLPAMPSETFRPPPIPPVAVTQPATPDGGILSLAVATDFTVKWTHPPNANSDLRIIINLFDVFGTNSRRGDLYCSFPSSLGQATIPASVLSEVVQRLGAPTNARLRILAGGQKIVRVAGATYVIDVTRLDSTSIGQFAQANGDISVELN